VRVEVAGIADEEVHREALIDGPGVQVEEALVDVPPVLRRLTVLGAPELERRQVVEVLVDADEQARKARAG
jgi:hypothetical protein